MKIVETFRCILPNFVHGFLISILPFTPFLGVLSGPLKFRVPVRISVILRQFLSIPTISTTVERVFRNTMNTDESLGSPFKWF
jgi:hypothetical protein